MMRRRRRRRKRKERRKETCSVGNTSMVETCQMKEKVLSDPLWI